MPGLMGWVAGGSVMERIGGGFLMQVSLKMGTQEFASWGEALQKEGASGKGSG